MTSPFIQHISDCKKRMRKLRKKIYKHSINNSQKKLTKKQDLSSALIDIFTRRAIPQAVISALKNKRNVDIFSLKSLVIGNQENLKWDHKTLKEKTNHQEKQIEQLYKSHRQRMEQIRKCQTPRVVRRLRTYVESTEIGFTSNSDLSQNNSYDCQSQQREEYNEEHEHSLSHNLFQMVAKQCKINQNSSDMRAISSFQLGDVNNCFQYGQSSILSNENIFNF